MGLLKPLRPTVLQKMVDTIEDVHFYSIKIDYNFQNMSQLPRKSSTA